MLIETDILGRIENELILNIEGLGFRVFIREISFATQIIQQHHLHQQQTEEEAASNDEVPGFEDIIEGDESDCSNSHTEYRIQQQSHGKETRLSQEKVNSNSNDGDRNDQLDGPNVEASINSASRTKTLMCSQNERSAEVFKRITSFRGASAEGSKSQNTEASVQEPPGFERRAMSSQDPRNCLEANAGNCLDTFNPNLDIQDNSHANKEPKNGTEKVKATYVKAAKFREATKNHEMQQSISSTADDSTGKIAKEAERIGKILGLTVIQSKKADAKRAPSVKKNKKPLN